jgi:DNA-binding transcriptional LysR family regulator
MPDGCSSWPIRFWRHGRAGPRLVRQLGGLTVEIVQVEAFLALADELHFGRAAERLHVSRSRVSQLIAALERQANGKLFERTSRRVTLTQLGQQFHAGVRPAYDQMMATLEAARAASQAVSGVVRVGCANTVSGPELTLLTREFCARHPDCELILHTVENADPLGPLRRGEIDVLVFYQGVDEPDLTTGPLIGLRERVLAVGHGHRLASRESVCLEDLGDEEVDEIPPGFPAALFDQHRPPATPSGRPIRRTYPWRGNEDQFMAVARGRIVLPAVRGPALLGRADLVLVPFRDLPPMPLGLIWCTGKDNARIRALAAAAKAIYPPPAQSES